MSEHEAGRELDALVAERVMGWTECDPNAASMPWEFSDEVRIYTGLGIEPMGLRSVLPEYSTRVAAAFEIVEKLRPGRWLGLSEYRDGWRAIFSSTEGKPPLHPRAEASTVPLAICLAALKLRPTPTTASPISEETA